MNSAESLDRWKKRYAGVVQEGKLSRADAERKLRLAEKNLGRAKRNLAVDPDEALINAETAVVNAADAVLAAAGFRVRGKTGSHEARLAYPQLPAEFQRNADRLARARELRSRAMYDQVDVVAKDEARELLGVATQLVAAAKQTLS